MISLATSSIKQVAKLGLFFDLQDIGPMLLRKNRLTFNKPHGVVSKEM
jgi:hypothetical protein